MYRGTVLNHSLSGLALFFLGVILLEAERLVDNLPENPLDRIIAKRPLIQLLQLIQHGGLAFRSVERLTLRTLDLADFDRTASAFVQQFDKATIEMVNLTTPMLKIHNDPLHPTHRASLGQLTAFVFNGSIREATKSPI